MIDSTKAVYKEEQQTVDIRFHTIYDQAVLMAEKVSVTPAMPQQAKRQPHRSNAPTESVNQWLPIMERMLLYLCRSHCES